MMAAILISANWHSAILVFPLKLAHTCQDWFPQFAQKKTSLIHFDSTWWWQPSWTLLCWIQTLPSWIQTPCYLLSDSLKNTLPPLWLWLKLIQSDSKSFILTELHDGNHLAFFQCEFCHLGFRYFVQNSDSNSFILTQLNDGSHLEVCHHGFSHSAQKNFIHSFCLNLMMAAILNSAMLDSDTGILDSDTLLSSLRFTQKHSPSTLTLTQTHSFSLNLMMAAILKSAILDSAIFHKTLTQSNSIWLKPIHSDWPWWWQPSWILSSWIQTFCTK